MHSARLSNSNSRSEGDEFRFRVSGYIALEEPQIFQRLPAAFDFGARQEIGVRRVAKSSVGQLEGLHAGDVGRHHALDGSEVIAALAPRQMEPARLSGCRDAAVEFLLR